MKWKPVFMETGKKACDFEAKGFLNNYVFSRPIQSSPHLRPNFEVCCSHTKAQKIFSGRKNEMKSQESLPTAIHIHGALHARKQPEAKTNKMTGTFSKSKIRKNQNWNWNSQNHKPNTGTETSKQKGEESYKTLTKPTNK